MFKSKRVVYIAVATVIIVIIGLYFINGANKLYGNDKQSIVKVIKSIEGYENQSIKIIEIKDIYDDRIVGFLANNNPAYIQFSKNQKGNYVWNHIESSAGQSFASFLINVKSDKAKILKFMVVTTGDNDIAQWLLDVNGKVIETDFRVKQNSVVWIDLPEAKTHTFEYKYFDENGNEIRK